MTRIKVGDREYVHDKHRDGYYGLIVEPGSEMDTTMGKIGIAWVYLQYASCPLSQEMRDDKITSLIYEAEEAEEEARERAVKIRVEKTPGMCPYCHTVCYGDCQS